MFLQNDGILVARVPALLERLPRVTGHAYDVPNRSSEHPSDPAGGSGTRAAPVDGVRIAVPILTESGRRSTHARLTDLDSSTWLTSGPIELVALFSIC